MLTLLKSGSKLSAFILVGVLAGCSSKVTEKSQYSGFLDDYSTLRPEKTSQGQQTLRWVSPAWRQNSYHNVYFAPVVYYPNPEPNERVSAATLEQIRAYTEQQLKNAVGQKFTLLPQPQPGSLIIKAAITAVTAENKSMQFYEVVPVAAVVASTMAATGHRTQNAVLFLEAEAIDATTHEPVIKVVRKGYGKSVPNSTTPVTLAEVKQAIDEMVTDTIAFPTY
ncbi:DUF3313 domain-containing protein [Mixta intestinalis]|jgi:hypothetical protein|uniref:DUF3313 domain-containing protein n=1 Tax=Mixta intestinalis TaxID=1615494 RepID=A0A6P1PXG7_9GAMM|nr:DUF3313 domain-containing protein [Mixta intestinalis]QHM70734.1 hypothetical protein C7M51_01012 [Mixta intestinalis]